MHLPKLPDIKASIWSGGAELKEYNDPHEVEEEGPHAKITARTYIEAIDGAEFELKTEVVPTYKFETESLQVKVYVDGKWANSASLKPHSRVYVMKGARVNITPDQEHIRKFLFDRIETTDDHDITKKPGEVDRLGEIEIQIHRMHAGGAPVIGNSRVPQSSAGKLSEKQLKGRAVSHGTKFGSLELACGRVSYRTAIYADGLDKPIAVFKFMYRSKSALRSMLIIPRTPSPSPPSPLRNRSEIKRNVKVSSTQQDVQVKTEKRVKRERDDDLQSARQKKRRGASGIIDLTADDEENQAPAVPFKKFKTEDGKVGIDLT